MPHFGIPVAPVGYLASSLVFATFCTKRMLTLRALAIASNFAFMAYGCLGCLWPVFILHVALLPMNILRLMEAWSAEKLTRPPGNAPWKLL